MTDESNMNPAIAATPPGSKRDKLLIIEQKARWSVTRKKRGKKTVIELREPDSGGWETIWPIDTEKDLDEPHLLEALHWAIHRRSGLDELKARVYGEGDK